MGDKQRVDCEAAKPGPHAVRGPGEQRGDGERKERGGRRLSNVINLHSLCGPRREHRRTHHGNTEGRGHLLPT